jgi:N-acetylglucosaminyldiphosphoundecaprenol N-acetyl-beta-D-mannosaminyltransferase
MSKQTAFDKLDLLGVEVDAITNVDAIAYITNRAAPGQPACYIVKPYVEFLDRAYHNDSLLELINGAELAIPDGVALTWAAAYLYAGRRSWGRFWLTLFKIVLTPGDLRWPLPDRAAGTNFTWPLLESAAAAQLKVFLIGDPKAKGSVGDISSTAQYLTGRLPSLKIIGTRSGRDRAMPRGQVSDAWLDQTANIVDAAAPDLILVGMGFPLQERVCQVLATKSPHGVFVGEGGTFDYASFGGKLPKAPAWTGRLGLEWLWRLALEPQRLFRQLAVPRFIYRVWRRR